MDYSLLFGIEKVEPKQLEDIQEVTEGESSLAANPHNITGSIKSNELTSTEKKIKEALSASKGSGIMSERSSSLESPRAARKIRNNTIKVQRHGNSLRTSASKNMSLPVDNILVNKQSQNKGTGPSFRGADCLPIVEVDENEEDHQSATKPRNISLFGA